MAKNPILFNLENILRYIETDECFTKLDDTLILDELKLRAKTSNCVDVEKYVKLLLQDLDKTRSLMKHFNLELRELILHLYKIYPEVFSNKVNKCIKKNFKL